MRLTDTVDALCTDLIIEERKKALIVIEAIVKQVREAERSRAIRIISSAPGTLEKMMEMILDEGVK